MTLMSEGRRRVDPQDPGARLTWIAPAVRDVTWEVQGVAGLEPVPLRVVECDLERALQDEHELFTVVGVATAAVGPGFDTEQARIHHGVAVDESLHLHTVVPDGPALVGPLESSNASAGLPEDRRDGDTVCIHEPQKGVLRDAAAVELDGAEK